MSAPFTAAVLSSGALTLPTAYTTGGRETRSFDDLVAFLAALARDRYSYVVLDLEPGDTQRTLDAVAGALVAREPKPYVAVFGVDAGWPPPDGGFAGRCRADRATPAGLQTALDDALPYVDLAERVAKLTDELATSRKALAEVREVSDGRQAKVARLERRVFDFFTLSQVGKALASIPGLDELTRTFLAMVREVYDSTNCSLMFYDELAGQFRVHDSVGLHREKVKALSLPIREGLFWQLLNAGEAFPIVDSQGSYRFEALVRRHRLDELESELWVPLKVKNSLVGILTVGPKPDGIPYSSDERSYIAQLANQATVAFESARLNIQKELATRELAKKMENLSILYSVSRAMNFMNDLRRVLMLILDKAVDAVNAQKASLMLLNEDTNELVVNVVRGVPPDVERRINNGEVQCARIKMGEGIAGRVAVSKKPILVDDVSKSGEFATPDRSYVDSILCVPLITSDECIGVINITNKKNGERFTQDDVDIMTTLAGQAAVTIYNAKLYYLAITDGLTGLHIHRYFQQRLKEEITRARRFHHPVSLIMMDIDHFKRVNDSFGHQQGDLVLMTTARVVRSSIREVDIASRYGGEEFAVICPETRCEEAAILAERLRRKIEEATAPCVTGPIRVTISLGVAAFPSEALTQDELVRAADAALYAAKEGGRNKVSVAPPRPADGPPAAEPSRSGQG